MQYIKTLGTTYRILAHDNNMFHYKWQTDHPIGIVPKYFRKPIRLQLSALTVVNKNIVWAANQMARNSSGVPAKQNPA